MDKKYLIVITVIQLLVFAGTLTERFTKPKSVSAVAGTASFSGSTLNFSTGNITLDGSTGTITAQTLKDTANTVYYLDPAASGTSILTAGAVGIATTDPGSYKLSVTGDGAVSSKLYFTGVSGGTFYLSGTGSSKELGVYDTTGTAAVIFDEGS